MACVHGNNVGDVGNDKVGKEVLQGVVDGESGRKVFGVGRVVGVEWDDVGVGVAVAGVEEGAFDGVRIYGTARRTPRLTWNSISATA